MGRKKIRNPYEKRSQVITVRLKIGEYQRLSRCASNLDMTISDVCRMYVNSGVDGLSKALAEEEDGRNAQQEKIQGSAYLTHIPLGGNLQ
jgi:hypothetical protein